MTSSTLQKKSGRPPTVPRTVKAIKAFAIVDRQKPVLDVFDVYKEKDVALNAGEMLIEVLITPVIKQ